MDIREATASEIPELKRLFWELDTDGVLYQPEHFQRSERSENDLLDIINSPSATFLLAVLDHEVVGFSLLYEKEVKGPSLLIRCKYAYLQDFVVTDKYRNRGIGTQLLAASKQWGKDRNLQYLRLSVFPANEAGIRFYKHHGMAEQMLTLECPL